jgi:hypothetical protein
MADFKLGRIKFKWRGNWATSTAYLIDDVLSMVVIHMLLLQIIHPNELFTNLVLIQILVFTIRTYSLKGILAMV